MRSIEKDIRRSKRLDSDTYNKINPNRFIFSIDIRKEKIMTKTDGRIVEKLVEATDELSLELQELEAQDEIKKKKMFNTIDWATTLYAGATTYLELNSRNVDWVISLVSAIAVCWVGRIVLKKIRK